MARTTDYLEEALKKAKEMMSKAGLSALWDTLHRAARGHAGGKGKARRATECQKASDAELLRMHVESHEAVTALSWDEAAGRVVAKSLVGDAEDHAEVIAEMQKRGLLHFANTVQKATEQDVRRMIQDALRAQAGKDEYPWVTALESIPAKGKCIYSLGEQHYRADYDCTGDTCTLMNAVEVQQEWEEVEKSDEITLPVNILKADPNGDVYGLAMIADDEAIAKWEEAGKPDDSKPSVIDTQGDFVPEDELVKAAEAFAADGKVSIGLQHGKLLKGAKLLQKAVLVKGTHWPNADSPAIEVAKAFALAVHTDDAEVKKQIAKGNFTGWSIGGTGERDEE